TAGVLDGIGDELAGYQHRVIGPSLVRIQHVSEHDASCALWGLSPFKHDVTVLQQVSETVVIDQLSGCRGHSRLLGLETPCGVAGIGLPQRWRKHGGVGTPNSGHFFATSSSSLSAGTSNRAGKPLKSPAVRCRPHGEVAKKWPPFGVPVRSD
ncbi:hypothetical protein, partial [Streptomyces lavenduligriseus]